MNAMQEKTVITVAEAKVKVTEMIEAGKTLEEITEHLGGYSSPYKWEGHDDYKEAKAFLNGFFSELIEDADWALHFHEGVISDSMTLEILTGPEAGTRKGIQNSDENWRWLNQRSKLVKIVARYTKWGGVIIDTPWEECPAVTHRKARGVFRRAKA